MIKWVKLFIFNHILRISNKIFNPCSKFHSEWLQTAGNNHMPSSTNASHITQEKKGKHFHLSDVISSLWWYQMLHPHAIMKLDISFNLFSLLACVVSVNLYFFLKCVNYVRVSACLHIINTPEVCICLLRVCLPLLSTWLKCVRVMDED